MPLFFPAWHWSFWRSLTVLCVFRQSWPPGRGRPDNVKMTPRKPSWMLSYRISTARVSVFSTSLVDTGPVFIFYFFSFGFANCWYDRFDFTVESRVVRMKEKINQLLKDMDNSANMALLKLPMSVREMNWLEYFSEFTCAYLSSACLCFSVFRNEDFILEK